MAQLRNRNKLRLRHSRQNTKRFMRKSWNRARKGLGLVLRIKEPNGFEKMKFYKEWVTHVLSTATPGKFEMIVSGNNQ